MRDRGLPPAIRAGLAAVAAMLAGLALLPDAWQVSQRERMFDLSLSLGPPAPERHGPKLLIVDIDRESLKALGSWPWRRGLIADMVEAAAQRGAAAIAVDILFAGSDQRSPGSVARRLAAETGEAALGEAALRLEDGDRRLASAIDGRPVALAVLMDPGGAPLAEGAPMLMRGQPALPALWSASGVQGPPPELGAAAAGLGVSSLPADADGVVRRVPVLVRAGDRLAPGLAAEAARLAVEASGYLLAGARLTLGDAEIDLPADGMLRLSPGAIAAIPTVPAAEFLTASSALPDLSGTIVLIGSSAPEAGGLRLSHLAPLVSSTSLQAMALRQLLAGSLPHRPAWAAAFEAALAIVCGVGAVLVGWRLRPAAGVAGATALAGGAWLFVIGLARADILVDPTPLLAASPAGFLATSLVAFSLARRREAALRRRFEQHLAPGVVERIAAAPDSLKLGGEKRRITALFTDVEGFTGLAARAAPEELIAVLDGYFEGVAGIVVQHGGMIDKFVGDAVHAFFNAPLDLPHHTDQALACALAIVRWTEEYRREGLASGLAMGRTRIGVEEGEVVVGDVGLATKLDYTAHGPAVNLAARLEALNKELGTAICIGPSAAGKTSFALTSLGEVEVRGVGRLEVHTPAAS